MDVTHLHPVIKAFIAGSISGTCSTVLFQPLDLLKTRIQAPSSITGTGGFLTTAGNILRTEKLLGLWKGTTPSLSRCVPGVGLYFASMHWMHIVAGIDQQKATPLQSIVIGVGARCISAVILIPFTVIKTRFESKAYQYRSIREALWVIYKYEGMRGLTCGLLPTLLRDAPFSGLYLMMYNGAKQGVPSDWIQSSYGPYVRFSCGILAGFGASLVTQPADVIKTKIQLYPHKFQSVFQVVPFVYKTYGVQGYFKGLMPRTIRRTLVAAMSWTVYEQLMEALGLK